MPQINTPSAKHKTGFRTKDGNTWEPYTDDKQIKAVTAAFMEIEKQIIKNKEILKTCNAAFGKLQGGGISPPSGSTRASGSASIPTRRKDFSGSRTRRISRLRAMCSRKNTVRVLAATLVHERRMSTGPPGDGEQGRRIDAPPCGFDDL